MLPCGHCGGSGKKCAPELTSTLKLMGRSWVETLEVARRLGLKQGAACNRMADLLKLGLVERRGSGSRHSPYEWRLMSAVKGSK